MKLEGKVAVITGAGQGIGRAIALALANEGANVVVNDINYEAAENVVHEINSMGRQGQAIIADVSKSNEVKKLVEKSLEKFGQVDILVNNAGIALMVPTEELTEAEWDKVININLKGTFLCSQALGREMIKQRNGKIINIASIGAYRGVPRMAAYCVSKSGVLQLTRVLAVEWAKYNINVNSIAPGFTKTALMENLAIETPGFLETRLKAIPLRRSTKPEEIAMAVLFLASSDSDDITGQVINIDGGTTALHPGVFPGME